MTKLYYGSVMSDGIRIQYYMTGEEKPPILLVHGFTDNGLSWNRVPIHLMRIYNVVVMDTRGHGFSGCGEGPFNLHDEAADMKVLVDALHLTKPVIMGHSRGASIAATASADYADVFSGCILIDPPWDAKYSNQTYEERIADAEDWRNVINKMKTLSYDNLLRMGKRKNPGWDASEFFQWAQSKYQMQENALQGIMTTIEPWQELVPKIKCPGLMLTANVEKGGIMDPKTAEEAKLYWNTLETAHFPNAGHNIHRESYQEFLDVIDPFLKRIRRSES
jgi:pimeloyl-ACP methyl ester carboxylesterase